MQAQIVTTDPTFPTDNAPVDIIFDAALSSGGLKDYLSDDVYAHTGVLIEGSSEWKYAPSWLDNSPKYKLSSLGNNKWKLSITPDIRQYYGVAANEKIIKMAFVFRNSDGSKEGKDNGKDIFVDVYDSALSIKFNTPSASQLIEKNTQLPIKATSSQNGTLRLLLNGTELKKGENISEISHTYTFSEPGTFWLIAEIEAQSKTARDSINIRVTKDQQELGLPQGTRPGINYIDDNTVILVLYAPGKKNVFVIGDFNDWLPKDEYMLHKADDYWWITLENLEKGKEYAFQYLVDGTIKIADPYTDKVLDPWNDSYIPASVYPNLKTYPEGRTTGIVSVLQTGQTSYKWNITDFKAPSREKLVIYELLIRDFTEEHSFESTKEKLDYLQSLGVNAIELLPINEFEGNSSWGYNPSFYFAVDKYYGTKDAFKAFVDECHSRGMAVIIDMVLNHSYGQSPFVQLYWDATNSKPSADNPWYNTVSPNNAYSWGYDFNHESEQTKLLVDSVCSYWINEYKVDGYRFDFTKGFTNTPGDGWAYDQARINILKRMASEIYKRKSDAIVILEHLADNSEETVLANADIMLWGNMNNNYCEAVMGYTENKKTDLNWSLYTKRGWSKPNLVSYMESHDEERMLYKSVTWGQDKSLDTGLERAGLAAAFYVLLPGTKMIWQFGEVGYDYSINTCKDGVTISDNCRVSEKPIRWDYLTDTKRKDLFDIYAKLISLKKEYDTFQSQNTSYSLENAKKYFVWKNNDMNAFLVGNFDVVDATVNVDIPSTGKWYEVFSETVTNISNTSYSVQLKPGEYKLFVDKNIMNIKEEPEIEENAPSLFKIVDNEITYTGSENVKNMYIYDLNGRLQKTSANKSVNLNNIPNSYYIIRVETDKQNIRQKFFKK